LPSPQLNGGQRNRNIGDHLGIAAQLELVE